MGLTPASEFLEGFPVFREAPGSLVAEVLASSTRKSFPAGLRLYSEGDSCHGIAFLLSGEIRVYKSGESGREITLYEIGVGETCILNASCILSGRYYPANAVAVEGGSMLLVPSAEFRRLVAKYAEMRTFVFDLLSQRLTSVMELIEEVAFGRLDERLMEYLTEKSEDGMLRATHQKIASDLGTSREVVSRILKEFERKGSLTLSRNLVTINTR
ncbi:MAG: Crp/Fnr family transcriptional regulator [Nitrospirae bacterium]|nr:Crp/Fnr family transcriptional regulator [Nitrospirota bacterium]